MTRKEARDLLARIEIKEPNEVIVNSWWESFVKDYEEAFQMAIEALEQQSSEDCISRQAVIEMMNYGILEDNIKDLPPVMPKEYHKAARPSKSFLAF